MVLKINRHCLPKQSYSVSRPLRRFGPRLPLPRTQPFSYICRSQSFAAESSSTGSSETPVTFCQTTRRHMPQQSYVCLHIYRRDNSRHEPFRKAIHWARKASAPRSARAAAGRTLSVRGKGAGSLQGTDRDGAPATKNDVCVCVCLWGGGCSQHLVQY